MSEMDAAGQRLPTYNRPATRSTKITPRWHGGWVGDYALPYRARVALGQLQHWANHVGRGQPVHPGWPKLARIMRLSESTCRRYVALYRRAGAVELVEQGGLGTTDTPNRRRAGRANVLLITPVGEALVRGREAPASRQAHEAPRLSLTFGHGRLLGVGGSVLPVRFDQPVKAIHKQKQKVIDFDAPTGADSQCGLPATDAHRAARPAKCGPERTSDDARRQWDRMQEAARRLSDVVSTVGRVTAPTPTRARILTQSGASGRPGPLPSSVVDMLRRQEALARARECHPLPQ